MKFIRQLFVLVLVMGGSTFAWAEASNGKDTFRSGTLAALVESVEQSVEVDNMFSQFPLGVASEKPLSGAIVKKSDREWQAEINNNTDSKVSIDLEAVQLAQDGEEANRLSFSVSLLAGESIVKDITKSGSATGLKLLVKDWKKE